MRESHDRDLAKKEALEAKQDKTYESALGVLKNAIPDLLDDMLAGVNDLVKDEGINYELDLFDLEDELRKYLIDIKKKSIKNVLTLTNRDKLYPCMAGMLFGTYNYKADAKEIISDLGDIDTLEVVELMLESHDLVVKEIEGIE